MSGSSRSRTITSFPGTPAFRGSVSFDHGEQIGQLLVVAVRVDSGLLDHRPQRGDHLRCHRRMDIGPVSACSDPIRAPRRVLPIHFLPRTTLS